jgi:hypothetical protein
MVIDPGSYQLSGGSSSGFFSFYGPGRKTRTAIL